MELIITNINLDKVKKYIHIKDNKGAVNKWLIEKETINSYKIFFNGFISEINKLKTFYIDDDLYTLDIRNAYTTLFKANGKKYSKATFCEIELED